MNGLSGSTEISNYMGKDGGGRVGEREHICSTE